ncbi:MAG: hypothetical protein MN733_31180 [Nitrososphaera sp.]|nr:hypothetical protein [Nitrososphaera sp.]
MRDTPIQSFSKFVLGFVVFVGTSIGLTVLATVYAPSDWSEQQAAAALAVMLEQGQ